MKCITAYCISSYQTYYIWNKNIILPFNLSLSVPDMKKTLTNNCTNISCIVVDCTMLYMQVSQYYPYLTYSSNLDKKVCG
jgi:hypothetical protein